MVVYRASRLAPPFGTSWRCETQQLLHCWQQSQTDDAIGRPEVSSMNVRMPFATLQAGPGVVLRKASRHFREATAVRGGRVVFLKECGDFDGKRSLAPGAALLCAPRGAFFTDATANVPGTLPTSTRALTNKKIWIVNVLDFRFPRFVAIVVSDAMRRKPTARDIARNNRPSKVALRSLPIPAYAASDHWLRAGLIGDLIGDLIGALLCGNGLFGKGSERFHGRRRLRMRKLEQMEGAGCF